MDDGLDKTTLSTLTLLESRLLRLEHLIYGHFVPPATAPLPSETAVASLASLERRFATLLSRIRVYAELLKIYKAHPTLFQSNPADTSPPTQLSPAAVRATVLSFAPAYSSTASALTAATTDTPIPDTALSASLAALAPKLRALEATRRAQEAEVAALRDRSERLVRAWYEGRVLAAGREVADVEGRIERVEGVVRRLERLRADEAKGDGV